MKFEKDLKEQFINQMKNIKEMSEKGASELEIEKALSYNLAVSECMNICSETEKFLNQVKQTEKMLGVIK